MEVEAGRTSIVGIVGMMEERFGKGNGWESGLEMVWHCSRLLDKVRLYPVPA